MTQHMDERFFSETGQAAGIAELANPVLQELGFDLVRVKLSGQDGNTVQIMIERPEGQVTIEDCTRVSRDLSPLFDAYDPMPGGYYLEISSPGIDRPLFRLPHYERVVGESVKLRLRQAQDNKRNLTGVLKAVAGDQITLLLDAGSELVLDFAEIDKAKLVSDL